MLYMNNPKCQNNALFAQRDFLLSVTFNYYYYYYGDVKLFFSFHVIFFLNKCKVIPIRIFKLIFF